MLYLSTHIRAVTCTAQGKGIWNTLLSKSTTFHLGYWGHLCSLNLKESNRLWFSSSQLGKNISTTKTAKCHKLVLCPRRQAVKPQPAQHGIIAMAVCIFRMLRPLRDHVVEIRCQKLQMCTAMSTPQLTKIERLKKKSFKQ